MKQEILDYLACLYNGIPSIVYVILVTSFCVGMAIILWRCGLKNGWRKIAGLLLCEYLYFIYSSTVIHRHFKDGLNFKYQPFWSYNAIREGQLELFVENILNVMMFIPIGFLLGCSFPRIKWWCVLLFGLCLSISVEAIQYIRKVGLAEIDDVIHNCIGCLIGYMLIKALAMVVRKSRVSY